MASRTAITSFSLKFVDIMVGIVLGLGFQWWPDLHAPWQYLAFIFVYLNLVDYWIDYSPSLRRWPPQRELDVLIHLVIAFTMFLLTYATLTTMPQLLVTFAVYRLADLSWLSRIHREYALTDTDRRFTNAWVRSDILEIIGSLALAGTVPAVHIAPLTAMFIFIALRAMSRVTASLAYRKVFFS